MIKTIVTTQEDHLIIAIPKEYVGKQVEVIVYATEEVKPKQEINLAPQFRGALHLTEQELVDFHQHAKDIRNEWERDI